MTTVCDDPHPLAEKRGALSFTEGAGVLLLTQEEREMLKHQFDGAVVTVAAANVLGLVPWPELAGLATFVWTIIRIYETKTWQSILGWVRTKFSKEG